MDEFYRMPSFATLVVEGLEQSIRWYYSILGFKTVFMMPGVGEKTSLCHLRLSRYADLMLVPLPEDASSTNSKSGIFLTFSLFEETVDDIAARLREVDIGSCQGPFDRPWNAREIIVTDPDGYRIVLTQPLEGSLTISEVIDVVKSS